jgi:hypothetical protein
MGQDVKKAEKVFEEKIDLRSKRIGYLYPTPYLPALHRLSDSESNTNTKLLASFHFLN